MSVFVIRPIGLLPVCILLLVLLIADNSGLNYIAQGQLLLFPKTYNSGSSETNSLPYINQQPQPITQTQPNPHLVKITLPVKGQQVPTGKALMIFGTSTSNATSDCKVSIKANGVGPYRDASPGGNSSSGRVDYTKWNFTLTPAYTLIKAGQNKITAKFACGSNPLLTSHYSVNVTGVNTAPNTISGRNYQELAQTQQVPASASKVRVGSLNGSAIDTTTPITSSNSFKSSAPSTNNHKPLPLSFSVDVGKSTAHQGDTQTVTVAVTDKNSSKPIAGASVLGNISSSSGLYKKVKGMTDSKGQASYSWTVSSTDLTGKYKVMMQGYAPNYQSKSAVKTFKVTSVPAVTTPSDSIDSSPTQFNPQPASNSNNNLIPPALTFPSSTTAAPPSTPPSITPHTKTKSHHHPSSTINPNPAASNTNNNNNLITPAPPPPPSTSPSSTAPPTKTKSHHHLNPTTNPNTSASNVNNNNNNNNLIIPPALTAPSSTAHPTKTKSHHHLNPTTNPNSSVGSTNNNNNLLTPPPPPPPSTSSITPHTKTKSHHHSSSTINPNPAATNTNNNNNLIAPPPPPPPSIAPSHHHSSSTINPGPTFGVPITTVPFTVP